MWESKHTTHSLWVSIIPPPAFITQPEAVLSRAQFISGRRMFCWCGGQNRLYFQSITPPPLLTCSLNITTQHATVSRAQSKPQEHFNLYFADVGVKTQPLGHPPFLYYHSARVFFQEHSQRCRGVCVLLMWWSKQALPSEHHPPSSCVHWTLPLSMQQSLLLSRA